MRAREGMQTLDGMTSAVRRKRPANPFPIQPDATPPDQVQLLHDLTADGEAGQRRQARALYWMGWRITHIAEHLGIARTTLHDWKKADGWDAAKPVERVEGSLEMRLCTLINKEGKGNGDYKEIDALGRAMERLARVHKYERTGRETDLNPTIERRNAGPKKQPERNHFTSEDVDKITRAFLDSLFDYQRTWWNAAMERTRAILKSRQIGATWYFAREALIDALQTGRNQIFLSASRAQAHMFRQYIIAFAKEHCDIELKGDPIVLSNGATLYFLGTSARTAQSYHGNLYFDEFFWVNNFTQLWTVASGMASQKQWRKTLFSTPSSLQHQAHELWSGERINKKRAKKDRIELNLSHDQLVGGFKGEDRIWRMIATILDAQRGGCNLFDIDELRYEYSDEEWDNLFMCGFVDDTFAVFPLSTLMRCHADSWDAWKDLKPFTMRPFGNKPVWIGYDPSLTRDSAGLVVLAPPDKPGGKFRVLERMQFKGSDFEEQAEQIRLMTEKYNVTHIALDSTGLGHGVYQIVKKFFPRVKDLQYSVELKSRLVMKAQSLMRAGRFEFDSGDVDLQRSFLAIKREMTESGRSVTYTAGRSNETGHADLAWACMNAMENEPLEAVAVGGVPKRTTLEIYG